MTTVHQDPPDTHDSLGRDHSRRPIRLGLAGVLLAMLAGCASYQPLSPPEAGLPPGVELSDQGAYLLITEATAAGMPAEHGVVFYPGGLVEPEAYVSLLAPLAAQGIPVAIVRMPADLAVLRPTAAEEVLEGESGTFALNWTLAGHSLGGAMAARFIARDAEDYEAVRGLILLASYPAGSDSLAGTDVPVLSIWADNDGLATSEDRKETASRLPADTQYEIIAGGNHAGFGEYGPQDDDGPLEIPREEQHRRVRELIVDFLQRL